MLHTKLVNCTAASNTFKHFATNLGNTIYVIYTRRKMQLYPFAKKNYNNFGFNLDAEMLIWMQSRFDGFDFFATLITSIHPRSHGNNKRLNISSNTFFYIHLEEHTRGGIL